MLNLALTTDKLQLITSAAAAIDVHASYADLVTGTVTPSKQNTAIVTAATTDIVAAPGSGVRNVKTLHIRNKDASVSCDVTVLYNANAVLFELHKATLIPGATLEYIEGVGFFTISSAITNLKNQSVAQQGSGFAVDTYLTGSSVAIPANLPLVGTCYRLFFEVTKTAVGTATPIITIRVGTAGAIGDTARCTLTFGAGTAAVDTGLFVTEAVFRTIGSGTSAVLQAHSGVMRGTGIVGSTLVGGAVATSAGFDSTVANSFIGTSYNGGASAVHTVQLVRAELIA